MSCQIKANQPQSQDPNVDWICLNCNNLNFAFRKKCNRCKQMTRQQNIQALINYEQYTRYYHYTYLEPQKSKKALPNLQQKSVLQTYFPSIILQSQQNINQDSSQEPQLPCVSPLVRRYQTIKKQDNKMVTVDNNLKVKSSVFADEKWNWLYSWEEKADDGWIKQQDTEETSDEDSCEDCKLTDVLTNIDFTFI